MGELSGKYKRKSLNDFLKMSLVPLPCQECQLNSTSCTNPESIEWLLDLKNNTPIWSRLNEINTSGYKRKLPMSMTKNYDTEINGRLWSLWGSKRTRKRPQNNSKSYMAITVMTLCAARVINLNLWCSDFMDTIKNNGRKYYKKSLKNISCIGKEFHLENLDSECCLEGISFQVLLTTVQQGHLYSTPLKCPSNLAFALIQFFSNYKFGLLECYNRVLGFGYVNGPGGDFFMYDAQSLSSPLFPNNVTAPYLLRTNHLQVLLYCLIITLNISHVHAYFCLHQVNIHINKPNLTKTEHEYNYEQEVTVDIEEPNQECKNKTDDVVASKSKYRRKVHNITQEEVDNNPIKPLVDVDRASDEDPQFKTDFVRMICSDTELPPELPKRKEKEFDCNLLDALIMGRTNCLTFKNL